MNSLGGGGSRASEAIMMSKETVGYQKVPHKESTETGKTDLFWAIYEKYEKIKISEKNRVPWWMKTILSNQKVNKRSEKDIVSI